MTDHHRTDHTVADLRGGLTADPRIPPAFQSATPAEPHAPLGRDDTPDDPSTGGSDGAGHPADPLRLCVATTVALIAWLITPPAAVVVFGIMAVVGYTRAYRARLLRSRCALGDTRLVLAYLGLAVLAGMVGVILRLA